MATSRGGARAGAGRKKKPQVPTSAVSAAEQRRSKMIYAALTREPSDKDSFEIKKWREIVNADPSYLWKMFEHSEGRAVHTVNHLHDKPIDLNVNLKLSERYRIAMAKAEKRVADR